MPRIGMLFNLDRCMDTRACSAVCRSVHRGTVEAPLNKVFTVTTGEFPNVETYFLPVMCQHCGNAPCIPACPENAIYHHEGAVLIAEERCVECEKKPCIAACPYNVIFLNPELEIVEKCDFCMDILVEGGQPACVQTCNTFAGLYGDLEDPESAISQAIAAAGDNVYQLLPEEEADPGIYYILTGKKWQGMKNLR